MNKLVLVALCACHPEPVRMPGYYPKPAQTYQQPAPRAPTEAELVGTWHYGDVAGAFYTAEVGVWGDVKGDAGVLELTRDGHYTYCLATTKLDPAGRSESAPLHPGPGCSKLTMTWQQGSWSRTGNTITLKPARAHQRMQDSCNAAASYYDKASEPPASATFTVALQGNVLTLTQPNGQPASGPYYR